MAAPAFCGATANRASRRWMNRRLPVGGLPAPAGQARFHRRLHLEGSGGGHPHGLALQEYVIGGMDPGFREQLSRAGRAMDADGIQWSMLSAFRDDYRQRLASGFKARTGNSLHGGAVEPAVTAMAARSISPPPRETPRWSGSGSTFTARSTGCSVRCLETIRRTSSNKANGRKSRWRCARPAHGSRRQRRTAQAQGEVRTAMVGERSRLTARAAAQHEARHVESGRPGGPPEPWTLPRAHH